MMYGRTGDNAMSHYNFGIFFKRKGKTDSAIHHFEQALKLFAPGSEKYAEISAEIDALKTMQFETDAEVGAMMTAILDRAFKGEL